MCHHDYWLSLLGGACCVIYSVCTHLNYMLNLWKCLVVKV